MIINCFLFPDIKTAEVFILPELMKLLVDMIRDNNIKLTGLARSDSEILFLIFDTEDDFILFKLRFSDNFSIEWKKYLMDSFGNNYYRIKEAVISFISYNYDDLKVY